MTPQHLKLKTFQNQDSSSILRTLERNPEKLAESENFNLLGFCVSNKAFDVGVNFFSLKTSILGRNCSFIIFLTLESYPCLTKLHVSFKQSLQDGCICVTLFLR